MDVTFEKKKGTEDWITPPKIVLSLGEFDLDPCACEESIHRYANKVYYKRDNGLRQDWYGRIWCNPPYGDKGREFIHKLALHGNGILLIFARTETKIYHSHIWNKADAIFFIKGRLKFLHPNGKEGGTAGSPSVLIAYGHENGKILRDCGLEGKFIWLK